MPNWCSNVCEIKFNDSVSLNKFVDNYLNKEAKDNVTGPPVDFIWKFSKIIPVNLDEYDTTGLNENLLKINAWGVKWEPHVNSGMINENSLSLEFDTPWGPPSEIYKHLISYKNDFGIECIDAEAVEPGMGFGYKFYNGAEYDYPDINKDIADEFSLIDINEYFFQEDEVSPR